LTAYHGATLLTGGTLLTATGLQIGQAVISSLVVALFFDQLSQVLIGLSPVGHRLTFTDEALLARYCWVLALFEQVFRAGLRDGSPLSLPTNTASIQGLLSIAPSEGVEDLCHLSWGFHDQFRDFMALPAVMNPTFDGSLDVQGADADLIVDHCLV